MLPTLTTESWTCAETTAMSSVSNSDALTNRLACRGFWCSGVNRLFGGRILRAIAVEFSLRRQRSRVLLSGIGFVWQFHGLAAGIYGGRERGHAAPVAGDRSAGGDVRSFTRLREVGRSSARIIVRENFPAASSACSLARALITRPKLLLADEPTGDLDGRTADTVFELIARLHRDHQLTSLVATHNLAFARKCHRVLRLQRGKMEEINPNTLSGSGRDGISGI